MISFPPLWYLWMQEMDFIFKKIGILVALLRDLWEGSSSNLSTSSEKKKKFQMKISMTTEGRALESGVKGRNHLVLQKVNVPSSPLGMLYLSLPVGVQ